MPPHLRLLCQAAFPFGQVAIWLGLWFVRRSQSRMREQAEFRLNLLVAALRAERAGRHALAGLERRRAAGAKERPATAR